MSLKTALNEEALPIPYCNMLATYDVKRSQKQFFKMDFKVEIVVQIHVSTYVGT